MIATGVTVPLIVAVALLLGGLNGGFGSSSPAPRSTAAVDAAAPPNAGAQAVSCNKVLEKLPVALRTLKPRVVHTEPETPYVAAWGDPAVVWRCGVAKPASLHPGSDTEFRTVDGLSFDLQLTKKAAVYTTVDRRPYISVTFPAGVQPATYLPLLVEPISVLPAVCTTDQTVADPAKLCTRRTS